MTMIKSPNLISPQHSPAFQRKVTRLRVHARRKRLARAAKDMHAGPLMLYLRATGACPFMGSRDLMPG
jgi:hypothetical protein